MILITLSNASFFIQSVLIQLVPLFSIWEPHPYEITYDYDGGALPKGITNPESYTVIHEPTAREIEANKNAPTGGLLLLN